MIASLGGDIKLIALSPTPSFLKRNLPTCLLPDRWRCEELDRDRWIGKRAGKQTKVNNISLWESMLLACYFLVFFLTYGSLRGSGTICVNFNQASLRAMNLTSMDCTPPFSSFNKSVSQLWEGPLISDGLLRLLLLLLIKLERFVLLMVLEIVVFVLWWWWWW